MKASISASTKSLQVLFRMNERFSAWLMHGFVAGLMALFTISVVRFERRLLPDFHASYLTWFSLFIAIDAIVAKRILRRASNLKTTGIVYRLIEWVVILLSLKVVQLVFEGESNFLPMEISSWIAELRFSFFDGHYIASLFVVALIWYLSGAFADDLSRLEGDEALLEVERLGGITSDRPAVRSRMVERIFIIGIGMVILAMLIRLDLKVLQGDRLGTDASVMNIFLYFILAFILLSLTQFAVLRASWSWDQIPIGKELATRWGMYSLIFILLVAIMVMFLPTRYTLGFLSTLGALVQMAFSVVHFIITILYFLTSMLVLLLAYLLSLLQIPYGPQQRVMPEIPTPIAPPAPGEPLPWFEFIKSLLFWVFFLIIAGYAFTHYLKENQEFIARLKDFRGLSWLFRFWKWVVARLGLWNAIIGSALREGFHRFQVAHPVDVKVGRRVFFRLGKQTNQEKVMFFYLFMVRRGFESGIPRKPSHTPYEYAGELEIKIDGVDQDVDSLTAAFVEARYSQHEVTSEQVGLAKRWWQSILQALRRMRHLGGTG